MKIAPSLKILYIIIISVVIFVFNHLYVTLSLLALQAVLWAVNLIPLKRLRMFKKIWFFAFSLIFFYSFFSTEHDFVLFKLFGWNCSLSTTGFYTGLLMVAKLLTMLAATFVVRLSTSPEGFMKGLTGLGLSDNSASMLDALIESVESRKGKRKKKKKGRDKTDGEDDKDSGKQGITIKKLLKGKTGLITDLINSRLDEARQKFVNNDIAVISAFSIVVTIIRFMKIAPGLPIAPGHKNMLIIPFFILSAKLTRKRFAATSIGFLSGMVHFMSGFGKYGPFGLLQFMVPALIVDMMMRLFRNTDSILIYGLIGLLAGASRVVAEISLALLFNMPKEFYLVYSPFIFSQCLFGVLSAPVTKFLSGRIK